MAAQHDSTGPQARVRSLGEDPFSSAWQRFAGAGTAQEFCMAWLDMQCQLVPQARYGLVVLRSDTGGFAPAAHWPTSGDAPAHLSHVVEKALQSETGLIEPGAEGSVCLAYPVRIREELFGAVVVEVTQMRPAELRRAFVTTAWGAGWLEVLFRRRQAETDAIEVGAVRLALDLATAAMEQPGLKAAAMALANEAAAQLGARSAALALKDGRKLRLLAFSRTAWFQKRAHLAQAALDAMAETLDQLRPVAYPELPDTARRIHVAHRQLAELASAGAILSVPLLAAGKPIGAVLLEFDAASPPQPETVLMLQATGAVCGSALADKQACDRLIAGRIPRGLAAVWRDLTDRRRVAGKLLLVAMLAAIAGLATARVPLRVVADAVVEGAVQQAIVAPVDGYLERSDSRPGDVVEAGEVLAQLDDRDLRLEVVRLESERSRTDRAYREALAQRNSTEAELQRATRAEIDAEMRLVRLRLDRLAIRAPIDGVIVAGDLSRELGTPIEKGDGLFEIAPLGRYRVVLKVDERDILLVAPGQQGELSLEAIGGARLPVTVATVTPVSTPQEGRNYFRVEAQIERRDAPLRPGMEGVGKVDIYETSLAWAWGRPLVNWARLQAWRWLP